ncbi:MAG: hypothetical protein VCD66_15825, partial [Alphaproteobacteria bacterium]
MFAQVLAEEVPEPIVVINDKDMREFVVHWRLLAPFTVIPRPGCLPGAFYQGGSGRLQWGNPGAVFFIDDTAQHGAEPLDRLGAGVLVGAGNSPALPFGQTVFQIGALGGQIQVAAAAVGVIGSLKN